MCHGHPYLHSDDTALLELASEDELALATLYDRYGGLVYGTAHRIVGDRHLAEEVMQDVFVSAWRSAGSYRRERGSVSTWLLAIARNRAIDATRRHIPHPVGPQDEAWAAEESEDTAKIVSAADESERIVAAVGELPQAQRQVLLLAYVAGLSHAEIHPRERPSGRLRRAQGQEGI